MPRTSTRPPPAGLAPLEQGPMVAAVDRRLRRLDGEREKPVSELRQRFSFSSALQCDRKRAFKALRVPPERDLTWRQMFTFDVGHLEHDRLQDVVVNELGGVVETPRSWSPVASLWGFADADLNLDDPDGPADTVGEFKTMKEYAFQQSIGTAYNQRDAPGPKKAHVTQAAASALAPSLSTPRSKLWLVYVSKNDASVAEWLIGVDDELPHLAGRTPRDLVDEEVRRVNGISAALDEDLLPGRCTEDGVPITDPANTNWPCGWCDWQRTCSTLPTGPTSAVPLLEQLLTNPTPTALSVPDIEEYQPW